MDWDLLQQELVSYVEIWRGRRLKGIYWIQIKRLVIFEERGWDLNTFYKQWMSMQYGLLFVGFLGFCNLEVIGVTVNIIYQFSNYVFF